MAPRGAAQAVYRNEVRRRLDPALLEQIGPRQYRLRVYPVEPPQWRGSTANNTWIEEAATLHMWLTWRVLAEGNAWPLPRLAEKRNVYWDQTSVRLINGEPLRSDLEAWLPATVPAGTLVVPVAHRIDFPGGDAVIALPVDRQTLPEPGPELRLAVVVDRSRSMAAHAEAVQAALGRLARLGADTDLYLTASPFRGEAASRTRLAGFDPASILYFGGQNAAELLVQMEELRAGQPYEAILILTDGSGYELGPGNVKVPVSNVPVWMVHLGGDIPLGYDDGTLAAVQGSGGGVTSDVDDALGPAGRSQGRAHQQRSARLRRDRRLRLVGHAGRERGRCGARPAGGG